MLPGDHLRIETATLDRQREGALSFVAGAHTSRAHDAARRIEGEVGITVVDCRIEMIAAAVAVADVNQADRVGHLVQLAFAAGLAFERVERMVRHVQFHHVAAQLRELLALRADFHTGLNGGSAGRGKAFAALDFDQAQAAGAEGFERVGGAELGNRDVDQRGGPH